MKKLILFWGTNKILKAEREKILHLEELKTLPFLAVLSDVNAEMNYKPKNETAKTEEEHIGLAEPRNAVRMEQSVSIDPDPGIDPEPGIDMEIDIDAVRQKQQLAQQHRESRCSHREKVQQENVTILQPC